MEEEQENPTAKPLKHDTRTGSRKRLRRMRLDTFVGMGLSNLIALFIILTTAATLHAHGQPDIQTSSQAAEALRPIAGPFAFTVFALGIIGTGLLALPVLAGSAAYAVGEALHWPVGLAKKPHRAKAFYGTIAVATVVGGLINFSSIDPMKALFWSAVVNGSVVMHAGDGDDDAACLTRRRDGRIRPRDVAEAHRLAGNRGDVDSRNRDVRDFGKLTRDATSVATWHLLSLAQRHGIGTGIT